MNKGFNLNSLLITALGGLVMILIGLVGWFGSRYIDRTDKLTLDMTAMGVIVATMQGDMRDLKSKCSDLPTKEELDKAIGSFWRHSPTTQDNHGAERLKEGGN